MVPAHLTPYALALLSLVIGAGSLLLFTIFLYSGPFHMTELGLGVAGTLVLDASLCLVFFLQHSGMIRRATRRWLSRYVSQRYLGAAFSVASGIVLFALLILWQESSMLLASADGLSRWGLRAIFWLAIAGQLWGIWSLKSADLFGTAALRQATRPAVSSTPLVVVGPYRWIRHPLYLTTLLMVWSQPDLTADRLLLNVLFTVWIIAGTLWEEQDLVDDYGEDYRSYQRRVPMWIPYRKPIET